MSHAPRLHQFVPTLDPGAVGSHILEIQRVLRHNGWDSEVFSEHTRPPYADAAHPYTSYGNEIASHPDDIVVYHLAIGSSVADWLLTRRSPRLVVYSHNITPPSWFEDWEPGLSYGLAWGRAQLHQLARRCILGIGVSEYNARELNAYGFRHTAVLPILLDTTTHDTTPLDTTSLDTTPLAAPTLDTTPLDTTALAAPTLDTTRLDTTALAAPTLDTTPGETRQPDSVDESANGLGRAGSAAGSRWLFVGRLAPNKCQQDVIKALALYRRVYDPAAHLWLVGGSSSDRYADALARFATDAGVGDAVTFTGPVSAAELAARYAGADVFVCLSEHEGFLVPLLEAWQYRLPVVAYSAAAVPETLGYAGILLSDKSPETVAAAVARIRSDPVVADALIAAGTHRLKCFSLARTSRRLLDLAGSIAAGDFDRGTTRLSG